ncbi:hypothetical protein ABID29_001802 [Streptococcus rupicaprae]|uniref:DUF1642 domain-containing protein n=1 Tax=Streptococcus rupicaprae TaxID=759619 RepID=A0ABV2FJC6_9STRE
MNKQEAIEKIKNDTSLSGGLVEKGWAIYCIENIDEPQKPKVPKVAIDYYEHYKDTLTGFDEWFGDFYDSGFLEEFPDGEKLAEWLYDNPNEVNKQRELALANLIVNGPSAVEVEQEKLYVINLGEKVGLNIYLRDINKELYPGSSDLATTGHIKYAKKFTESEIRKDFEWAWSDGFAKEVE